MTPPFRRPYGHVADTSEGALPWWFFPYIVLVWLVIAGLLVFTVRGLAERVRTQRASSEEA